MAVKDTSRRLFNSSFDLVDLYSVNTGMKAWLKAPSATILLNRFGIFSITTKMSWAIPAPNTYVVVISLKTPKTLEIKVQKETENVLKDALTFSFFEEFKIMY